MIYSLYNVDFIYGSTTLRLVNVGDFIDAELKPVINQPVNIFPACGVDFADVEPMGGAHTTIAFSVRRDHISHAQLRGAVFYNAYIFPSQKKGTLRISINGGDVWDLINCGLTDHDGTPMTTSHFRTLTSYKFAGSKIQPYGTPGSYTGAP